MEFIKVAEINDVPVGTMKRVSANEQEILLSNIDGEYYAIGNRCTHAGGSLAEGKLEGNIVTCPRHGARFDVKTGIAVSGPKIVFLKLSAKEEKRYQVKVDGNDILIEIA